MKSIIPVILGFILCAGVAHAVQPARFNYQAKLSDSGGVPLQGSHSSTFWIYEGGSAGVADSGTLKYKETVSLNAANGVVSHVVGTGTPVGSPLQASIFQGSADLFVQVAVDAESNVVLPRQRLESVPFALASADSGASRKPLSQPASFPIYINEPGSYYFTGNITGVAATTGIQIDVGGVHIDLNGYTLSNTGGLAAILGNTTASGISVSNGSITGWSSGVVANSSPGARVNNLQIHGCSNGGISLGANALVEDCVVTANQGANIVTGIYCTNNASVRNCISSGNVGTLAGIGIDVADGSLVENCVTASNAGAGNNGIGAGIRTFSYTTVQNCVAQNNACGGASTGTAVGIDVQSNCVVRQNNCSFNRSGQSAGNAYGIRSISECQIVDNVCAANNNTVSGSGICAGIIGEFRNRIERNNCTAHTGALTGMNYGIFITGNNSVGNAIVRNSTTTNLSGGIRLNNTSGSNYTGENFIDEDTPVSQNAGGVHVTGAGDRANILM